MEEEQATRFERMEKNQQELQEQMAKVMQMMESVMKEAAEASNIRERASERNEDPSYPLEFAPSTATQRNNLKPTLPVPTYPSAPYPLGPIVGQVPLTANPGTSSANPIPVLDLDDLKEQEKLGKEAPTIVDDSNACQKYELLEERLRAIEGLGALGRVDASELSLVPGLIIPPKFKVPEFEKYNGSKCPATHIKMYCMKMSAYLQNEKLMIHCFGDSLTGSATRWYVKLDRNRIRSWKDLATAFLDQYQHVMDMAPDRMALQNMEKKPTETFKEYAQRWYDLSLQVDPPLTEKETTTLFVETLEGPYYDRLMANATKSFANLILSGTMIETAIKNGKIEVEESPNSKKIPAAKKEEIHAVLPRDQQYPHYSPYPMYPYYQPYYLHSIAPTQPQPYPNKQSNHQNNSMKPKPDQEKPRFDLIPMSYTQLYPQLVEHHVVAPVFVTPRQPPFPDWYDTNAICEYHGGAGGHSLEDCIAFKKKVQSLLKSGVLTFGETGNPNINMDPSPNHIAAGMNGANDN